MQATFHWLRIETFCYATEKEELVSQTFRDLVGTDEFQTDVSESEHGKTACSTPASTSRGRSAGSTGSRITAT